MLQMSRMMKVMVRAPTPVEQTASMVVRTSGTALGPASSVVNDMTAAHTPNIAPEKSLWYQKTNRIFLSVPSRFSVCGAVSEFD